MPSLRCEGVRSPLVTSNDLSIGERRDMEANRKTVKINMDGNELQVPEGITILDAAQKNGIYIPTLCHHPALTNWGGCRMCMVEVDGSPKLVASCVMPIRDGMDIVTTNDRILESRRVVLEFLFSERNHNCMFCPQSGECELQKLAYELGMDHLTVSPSFDEFPTDATSDYMIIDHNRCILCGRCVRACAEIAGTRVLSFHNRGPRNLVGLDLNASREESTCYSCGVCLQVCPTGAIYNRYRTHYAVKGHSKDWKAIESLCPQCGLLCPTVSTVHDNTVLKIDGKLQGDGEGPDRGQLCYLGRFEPLKNEEKRLLQPMVRDQDGTWKEESWENALNLVAAKLKSVRRAKGGKAIFGLASSALCNEELFFFRELMTKGCTAEHVGSLDGTHFRAVAKAWEMNGKALREASWTMIPKADCLILLGAKPHQTQPLLSALIRKNILERGIKVSILGEMDLVPPFVSSYFPVKEEKLPLLMKALREAVLERGKKGKPKQKVDVPSLLKEAGLSRQDTKGFHDMVEEFRSSTNPLLLAGEAITGLQTSQAFQDAVKLALWKGLGEGDVLRLMVLKEYGNSAGAWKLGLSSNGDSKGKTLWKAGLALLGSPKDMNCDALTHLRGLDFLGVISPYFPKALADRAHVIIPKRLWMEEFGSFTSLDGWEIGAKPKVLEAPEGVRESLEILSALADGIGFRHNYKSWGELSEKAEKAIRRWTPVKKEK
jgi:NADH dehydrogenase/NADH:ubiquinone oxidoreductase subunit G